MGGQHASEYTGKDIKIAVFDDKVEITSPGNLLPTVDFNDMESGQSDIRNKTLAPVFKKLGIIEQWGNGLQLIAEDLKQYPEIDFQWSQPGMGFRMSLINTNVFRRQESGQGVDKKQPAANDYERLRTITNDYERLSIERKKILLYLMDNERITRKEAAKLISSANTKSYEILTSLVEKQLISIFGKGRGTYYSLKKHS